MGDHDDMQPNAETVDDDRLLAYALGLEDDPGLEAAAEADAALRTRIAAMRADVGVVAAGLDRVVPAPPDEYTDLSGARWGELHEFVAAPAPAAPRRRPMWLRVLAPAAAIALVLVAGVVGLQRLGTVSGDEAATVGSSGKATESYDRQSDGAEGGAATGAGEDAATPSLAPAPTDPAVFRTIVVARANAPANGRQTFVVKRVLKGRAPAKIRLEIVDAAAAAGELHVLFLLPSWTWADEPANPSPMLGSQSDAAPLVYSYRDRPGLAQPLPPGTDAGSVKLP
jgi:hypothetical protein